MYVDVRGANGRFLFKYDPQRRLVRMKIRGVVHIIDLTELEPLAAEPLAVDREPLTTVN